ncbi:DUF488 domain-containing protein [Actinomycetospora cinnamomea]|uniref:DUF488 domain-containing protein n=1 Tax=Actinomycetospora cinnamomea TaxID=663609 RepID=UPI001FAFAFD3|nr:DUF488 family protein [Actinomycetospora cinnamomea]
MAAQQLPVHVLHVKDGRAPSSTTVLVDRLWPRGRRKDDAPWDEWLRAVAPTDELRRWYGHDPDRFEEFARRYRRELEDGQQADALADLVRKCHHGPIALMTATRDLEHSHARVLADLLADRLRAVTGLQRDR